MPVRLVRCERAAVLVAKHQLLAIAAMRAEDSNGLILQFNLSRTVPFGWSDAPSNAGPSNRHGLLRQVHVAPSQTEQLPEAKAGQSERNHRSPSGLSRLDQPRRVVVRQLRTNPRLGLVLSWESRELGDDALLGAEREHLPQARQNVAHRLVSAFGELAFSEGGNGRRVDRIHRPRAQRRQDVQAQKIGLGLEARRRARRACGVEISTRELIEREGLNEAGWTRIGRSYHWVGSFAAT
jgi:hypothetical protein